MNRERANKPPCRADVPLRLPYVEGAVPPTVFSEAESERLLAVAHELAQAAGVSRLAEYLFLPVPALLEILTRKRPFRRLLVNRLAVARGRTADELYPESAQPSPLVALSRRLPNACECVWIARMSAISEDVLAGFIDEIAATGLDRTTLEWTADLRRFIETHARRADDLELPDGSHLGLFACARLYAGLQGFPVRAIEIREICELAPVPDLAERLERWRERLAMRYESTEVAELDAAMAAYWSRWREALEPPTDSEGEVPLMPLGEYASVCAELEARPSDAYAIFLRHGLAQPHTRQAIRDRWMARFEAHPGERAAFERLVAAALARLRPGGEP